MRKITCISPIDGSVYAERECLSLEAACAAAERAKAAQRRKEAAERLQISYKALLYKMKEAGLSDEPGGRRGNA